MTDPKTVPVLEPEGKLKFSSLPALRDHVNKHVLDRREERWSQLFDAEIIAGARRELEAGVQPGPCAKQLMREYHRLGRDTLLELCRLRRGHWHYYSEQTLFSDDGEILRLETPPDGAVQTVLAWDLTKKLMIVAKSFVRNGEFVPYVLCSVYRPFPRLSGSSLQKNMRKRQRQRNIKRRGMAVHTVIADHDD